MCKYLLNPPHFLPPLTSICSLLLHQWPSFIPSHPLHACVPPPTTTSSTSSLPTLPRPLTLSIHSCDFSWLYLSTVVSSPPQSVLISLLHLIHFGALNENIEELIEGYHWSF